MELANMLDSCLGHLGINTIIEIGTTNWSKVADEVICHDDMPYLKQTKVICIGPDANKDVLKKDYKCISTVMPAKVKDVLKKISGPRIIYGHCCHNNREKLALSEHIGKHDIIIDTLCGCALDGYATERHSFSDVVDIVRDTFQNAGFYAAEQSIDSPRSMPNTVIASKSPLNWLVDDLYFPRFYPNSSLGLKVIRGNA